MQTVLLGQTGAMVVEGVSGCHLVHPHSPQVALEMLFTGEPISAQEALRHGLLSRVVPAAQLEEETLRVARKIASLSRPVLALGKAAFFRQLPQDLSTAYHLASQTMVDNLALPDGQEGIRAFLQKRKPSWCRPAALAEE